MTTKLQFIIIIVIIIIISLHNSMTITSYLQAYMDLYPMFRISWTIWAKFGIEGTNIILWRNCELMKNGAVKDMFLFEGVNKNIYIFSCTLNMYDTLQVKELLEKVHILCQGAGHL